jgi:hypothetical protein
LLVLILKNRFRKCYKIYDIVSSRTFHATYGKIQEAIDRYTAGNTKNAFETVEPELLEKD